jgi:transposase InsO family protein
MDIAGNRLINHFVDRGGDAGTEVRAALALADGMTAGDGVIIYPEGTRFTAARRQRILEGLGDRDSDLAARTARLRHVLPPRPGGTSALLGTGNDVVVVAHHGLESLATIPDAWSGEIVGAHLRIRFTRFRADHPGRSKERSRGVRPVGRDRRLAGRGVICRACAWPCRGGAGDPALGLVGGVAVDVPG